MSSDRTRQPQSGRTARLNLRDVAVRRVYDEPSDHDGTRVLVDRVWPRGLRKSDADLDEWRKDLAPSTSLRTWYGHDPARFEEFDRRYRAELDEPERAEAVQHLGQLARAQRLTLLTGTKQLGISHAVVLADLLCHPQARSKVPVTLTGMAANRRGNEFPHKRRPS